MPTMPPEAMNRPKPKMPHAQTFGDLPKPVVPKTENRKLLKGQKAIVTGASSGIGRSGMVTPRLHSKPTFRTKTTSRKCSKRCATSLGP